MKMRRVVIIVVMLCLLPPFASAQECDYNVEILIEGTEFTIESFKWRMKATKLEGKSANMTGIARIEDLKGNLIKSYKPWTNLPISKQKTSNEYTPNLNGGDYRIVSEISVDCDDINKGNNMDFKIIRIKSEKIITQDTNITTQQSTEENWQPQQNFMQQTQENKLINNSATESQNNVTQNLENNAKEYENTVTLKNENAQESGTPTAELVKSYREEYTYVSSNEKAKTLIIYFLLGISIVLNVVLIWRR